MKAEETRKKLISELNAQYNGIGSSFGAQKTPDDPIVTFPSPMFQKPKMFEAYIKPENDNRNNLSEIPMVRGIGFKDTTNNEIISNNEPQEIYNMKELIASNPESMRTISYDVKTVKAQMALVKKRDWQEILFSDVDLFKPINITAGIKKLFKW